MDNERDLSNEFHIALDAVLPPAPLLEAAVRQHLRRERPWRRPAEGSSLRLPRISQKVAAGLILAILAATAFGVLLATHRPSSVPARTSTHAVPRAEPGMVSSTVGWQGGSGQTVQRTTDGGAHWAHAGPSSYVPSLNDSSYFLDATHAWLTTTEGNGPLKLITFRTVNGGKTWDQGAVVSAVGVNGLPPRLYFLDPTHGWLLMHITTIGVPASDAPNPYMGEDAMYRTTDGGLHWTPLATNLHTEGTGCDWKRAAFASVTDGWLTVDCTSPNDSQLWLATHDGGKTWTPQEVPLDGAGLACPCAADPITVFDRENAAILVRSLRPPSIEFISMSTQVYMTMDGGNSWTVRRLPGVSQLAVNSFPGADFIDPKHGWTVAGPSALFVRDLSGLFLNPAVTIPLYRTDDGGLTWVAVETNLPLVAVSAMSDLYFVDLQHGFVHGSQFFKTEDGGHHWAALVPEADDCPITISSTCTFQHA